MSFERMKKGVCIGVALCLSLLACRRGGETGDQLRELDRIVARPVTYEQQKEERIDALKRERLQSATVGEQMAVTNRLVEEYKVYMADSALFYAQEELKLARKSGDSAQMFRARMQLAEVRIITGMYQEALNLLNELEPHVLPKELLGNYYRLYNRLYGAMRDYAVGKELRQEYEHLANMYRDSLLRLYPEGEDTHILVGAEQLICCGKYGEALDLLLPYYRTLHTDSREVGYTAYSVADAYRHMGDREKEKDYLIVSSLADLKSGVKEYISLRELAVLLYEEGDIVRSYSYMKRAMEDAAFCNARLRTVEVSQVLPIIHEAYRLQTELQRRQMLVSLLCISLLALFLIVLDIYLRRQMRRLATARREVGHANTRLKVLNDELQELNARLSDSNRCLQETNNRLAEVNYIKEAYIGRFLDLCSVYLGKLDAYRRSLNKMAMGGKTDDLFRELKSTQFVDEELEEFYRNFDTAFLHLFPDFVADFNALLTEGEEVVLKPGELLNTELRIFALIRLGIADSNKIAEFLRYSLKTIYNYRTKMRNKAKGIRDDFEKEVMRIGTY